MSDLEKWQIADAMSYVDPDYITEYDNLSAYISAKKAARRRRINMAGRLAACVAVVALGAYLTVQDINNGLIGNNAKSNEEIMGIVNDRPTVRPANPDDYNDLGNVPGAIGATVCIAENIYTTAPTSEIGISVFEVNKEGLTLEYVFNKESKAKWYTENDIVISQQGSDEVLEISDKELEYRLTYDENNVCKYVYSWGDVFGPLSAGNYNILTYVSDGNVTYEVWTQVSIVAHLPY